MLLFQKDQAILTAVNEGRISPEEGNHRLAVLAHYGNLAEKEDALARHRDSQEFSALFKSHSLGGR